MILSRMGNRGKLQNLWGLTNSCSSQLSFHASHSQAHYDHRTVTYCWVRGYCEGYYIYKYVNALLTHINLWNSTIYIHNNITHTHSRNWLQEPYFKKTTTTCTPIIQAHAYLHCLLKLAQCISCKSRNNCETNYAWTSILALLARCIS